MDIKTPDPPAEELTLPNLASFFTFGLIDPVKFIDAVLTESVEIEASDILFEPQKESLRVRIRVDGVLYELGQINLDSYQLVSARLKVLANLDPTESRKIQEGQISVNSKGIPINFRIEIAKTVYGELIVIRIHERKTIVMSLDQLGLNPVSLQNYKNILAQRSGLLVVCGPTGCGKTTTLYTTITELNKDLRFNIMTIEDPVEFRLEGVNQMQVQKDIDFTFAAGLKTILRLSPDVVLVGEIRDKETAEIAVESGLTGQLVLSTLHAEDSVGSLFRLLDLGIETYLLNSSLIGLVAQRLVRKVCPSCKKPYEPEKDEVEIFQKYMGRPPKQLVRGEGCQSCNNIGFKGRMGIFEVLVVNSHLRELTRSKANETELRDALIKNNFVTLLKDGLEKAEQGQTTIKEVLRNSLRTD
jgi:type II secretory ATPase GspE/PulE/Tfp pilus assembly ATPase PilB-like protein